MFCLHADISKNYAVFKILKTYISRLVPYQISGLQYIPFELNQGM